VGAEVRGSVPRGAYAVLAILVFFIAHWLLSVFCQTFYLHRYGAHKMFTMSKGWERCFHLLTYISQGSSYLNPRAYAILHREHHAFSDTPRDPHSPHMHPNLYAMMWATRGRYQDIQHGRIQPETRFAAPTPEWPLIDRFGRTWVSHAMFMGLYTAYYVAFAPSWHWFLLLPVHFLMGPIHGAIVNWCGHKYGYRNFVTTERDRSRNTLVFDFLTMGELFQNNHHKYGMSANFAARWFEVDPTYPIIKLLAFVRIVDLGPAPQRARFPAVNTG
jgi:stearoyl-CoA desaturase (delta-9 desaturase)